MHINLIPVCEPGISYGSEMMTEAIARFRNELLAVIVVCSEDMCDFLGDKPTPSNITRLQVTAAIVLFREPETIGQVTGFIHENGININLSGTGGSYGKRFMECLTQYGIQPWFYPTKLVYEHMRAVTGKSNDFRLGSLTLYERLQHWKYFLIDKIVPNLHTEALGLLDFNKRTGTWQTSWQANDQESGYIDRNQLEAILSNTEFYRTFFDEISNLHLLNGHYIDDPNIKRSFTRLIYVGVVTCLETYLCDAFINTVLSKKENLESFFDSYDFSNRKINMNQVYQYSENLEENAKKEMVEVIYHNLPKVSNMYKQILGIPFPDFSSLQRCVEIRHDLVHRNGKTKEGEEVYLTQADVTELISEVKEFVDSIEQELKASQ